MTLRWLSGKIGTDALAKKYQAAENLFPEPSTNVISGSLSDEGDEGVRHRGEKGYVQQMS